MKAVLFDFGGTIDTDGVHWSEKYWELYQRYHIEVSKKEYEASFVESERRLLIDPEIPVSTFGETIRKQLTVQFVILNLDKKDPRLQLMINDCYRDVRNTIASAKMVLEKLQPRYALGVVSNFYGNLEVVCKEFGLATLFGAKIDSVVVGVRKPDPAIFGMALKKLGVAGANTFVVGDSYERDIVPGKQLGCNTIWLKGKSWMVPASTEAADYTIHSFEKILTILL
jgi:putative hydrolase of the HAD superfamily